MRQRTERTRTTLSLRQQNKLDPTKLRQGILEVDSCYQTLTLNIQESDNGTPVLTGVGAIATGAPAAAGASGSAAPAATPKSGAMKTAAQAGFYLASAAVVAYLI